MMSCFVENNISTLLSFCLLLKTFKLFDFQCTWWR